MTKKAKKFLPFTIGALFGAMIFIGIFGTKIISTSNIEWIFAAPDDTTQHYLGWMYYRNTPWQFPIGMTEGLSSEGAVCCTYADVIPLFAVFFKLLSPILPETFQYFGLWGIICFALNGGLGAVLLSRIKNNIIFTSIGSLFYSVFFPTITRITHHNALGAIWLIIAAMILTLDYKREYKHRFTPILLWTLVCVLAAVIHPYFIPMVYTIMLGYLILLVFKEKKIAHAAVTFVVSSVTAAASLWILGAFEKNGSMTDNGFTHYSANLNTFFNGRGISKYLSPLTINTGQGEGFGYLGLGMLVCCFLAIVTAVSRIGKKDGSSLKYIASYVKKHKVEISALVVVFLVGFFWATSTKITLNEHVIFELHLSDFLMKKLSIFRASGRFIWGPCLIVMTTALWIVSKLEFKTAITAVFICAWLQGMDVRSIRNVMRAQYINTEPYEYAVTDEEWETISGGINEVVFLPLPMDYVAKTQLYYDFARPAAYDHIKLSSFIVCRADYATLKSYADEQYSLLSSGKGRTDALYVFFKEEDIPSDVDNIIVYDIGEYKVARVKK